MILLSSCAVNRTIPEKRLDASIVPTDFNPEKHILLVEEMHRVFKPSKKDEKRTQKMEELFKKYYPYKFEIVSAEIARSKDLKYADTSVYKYVLLNSYNRVRYTQPDLNTYFATRNPNALNSGTTATYLSYYFSERGNNKKYKSSYPSPYIKPAVEAFANTVKKAQKS